MKDRLIVALMCAISLPIAGVLLGYDKALIRYTNGIVGILVGAWVLLGKSKN